MKPIILYLNRLPKVMLLVQGIVIVIAVGLPWLQKAYMAPKVEKLLIQNAENEAVRVARHIKYVVLLNAKQNNISFSQQLNSNNFDLSPEVQRYLKQAITDFNLWQIKLFNARAKVIYSNLTDEIGIYNRKPYFQDVVAQGNTHVTTAYQHLEIDTTTLRLYVAEISVPIMNGEQFAGAFEIYYDITENRYMLDAMIKRIRSIIIWLSVLSVLMSLTLGFIIHKTRTAKINHVSRLFKLATVDSLTQLANRRSIEHALNQSIRRYNNYKIDHSLILFDVDKFKQVNDAYGHHVGDEVLIALAKVAKSLLRDTDIVSRYGGEEFIALLPNTHADGAKILAEKLRQAVEETNISTADGDINITISLGVVSFVDVEPLTPNQAIHQADQAMYAAKHAGRNTFRYAS